MQKLTEKESILGTKVTAMLLTMESGLIPLSRALREQQGERYIRTALSNTHSR